MRHKTKDKGDLGVAKTIPHLLDHGMRCCLPPSEHLPFDLIAVEPDMKTLKRVRVGYQTVEMNPFTDMCAVYDPGADTCHFFDAGDLPDSVA